MIRVVSALRFVSLLFITLIFAVIFIIFLSTLFIFSLTRARAHTHMYIYVLRFARFVHHLAISSVSVSIRFIVSRFQTISICRNARTAHRVDGESRRN